MRRPPCPRVDPALAPYFERVRGKLSEAEFLAKVEEGRAAFDGLLDDEALALLVLDEMGLNEGAYVTLSELGGRSEATVRVSVDGVEPPRTFARASGGEGRVANCLVSDATGSARMVLWDKDVERVEDGTLRRGARLTLVNARVKQGRYGVELHVGPWTVLEIEGALDPARRKLLQDVAPQPDDATTPAREARQTTLDVPEGPATMRGVLHEVFPTRTFRKQDGSVGFVCDADVETDEGRVRLVAWEEHVKPLRAVKPGDPLVVEHVVPKVRGAATEWHTTRESRVRPA